MNAVAEAIAGYLLAIVIAAGFVWLLDKFIFEGPL